MIKLRRGSTKSWRGTSLKLEPGQPGYDKNKHKIKIGDGKTSWKELPYASGLFANEILDSEAAAKHKKSEDAEDLTLITYGETVPDKNTVGQLYLQQYDTEPEVDYVVSVGIDGIWTYQLWKSGIAKCWGNIAISTELSSAIEGTGLFHDKNKMKSLSYPFAFKEVPAETATLQSPGWIAWLANKTKNTKDTSGIYTIISPDEQAIKANYSIAIQVEGLWK
jgi:predicted secreted protein